MQHWAHYQLANLLNTSRTMLAQSWFNKHALPNRHPPTPGRYAAQLRVILNACDSEALLSVVLTLVLFDLLLPEGIEQTVHERCIAKGQLVIDDLRQRRNQIVEIIFTLSRFVLYFLSFIRLLITFEYVHTVTF